MKSVAYVNLIEELLCESIDCSQALYRYKELIKYDNENPTSKTSCVFRVIRCVEEYRANGIGVNDLLSNMRQVILTFNSRIIINKRFKEKISDRLIRFGLDINGIEDMYEINASLKLPSWLGNTDDFNKIYEFEIKESCKMKMVGDVNLYGMTSYIYYTSLAQKATVRATINQMDGSTILACMPTGGGKSLTNQLPAFYDKQGTSIVVVPTVSLAIDQMLSSMKFFKNNKYKPQAYYSDLDKDNVNRILKELADGKIPIIYISPEALLNSRFTSIVMKAANNGLINRLVIDEAHIVTDWGEFFRTDFQFIAIFRRNLYKATENKLKTLLLSATVSDKTSKVLRFLFSEENNFIEIRGDALRQEIIYYVAANQNLIERNRRLVELIPYLPRPFIIYVPTIATAEELKKEIKENSFYSVEVFTSKTRNNERLKIIELWNSDKIDIMIATSAFGMGVDKKDVRGVVHCYVPENIDRFYQEIGRCGRDGFNSYSILLTSFKDDNDTINYLTRSKVLTVEKIVHRWEQIRVNYRERVSGSKFWIDTDIAPEYLIEKEYATGSLSATWNEYVLLFLYRQKLIDILEVKLDENTGRHIVLIEILNEEILGDSKKAIEYLTPIREKERSYVNRQIEDIKNITKERKKCWATYFTKVYKYATERCSGCPSCRGNKTKPYNSDDYLDIVDKKLFREIFKKRSTFDNIIWIVKDQKKVLTELDFNNIIQNKVDNLIIPNISDEQLEKLLEKLDDSMLGENIFSYEEFLDRDNSHYILGTAIILFSRDAMVNDKLFNKLKKDMDRRYINGIVAIAYDNTYLSSENRFLKDCIEGTIYYL